MPDIPDDQQTELQPPRQLGNYRILAEIGRGGVGVVYEAEQITLRRRVALKLLPAEVASNEANVQRFEREARAAGQMHHTNIVPVFEVGRSGPLVFYTMQLIRGCGVDDLIDELAGKRREERAAESGQATSDVAADKSATETKAVLRSQIAACLLEGRFPSGDAPAAVESADESGLFTQNTLHVAGVTQADGEAESYWRMVARIGFDAASALAHSHAQGIVHRDIKPSNLILDDKGVLWVTDFGLALTEESNITRTGDVLGTLRYLAPERFEGRCDARSDIYALGLTLYELITLKPAFASKNRWKLIRQICKDDPPTASSLNPEVPRDLETIVRKASEKDPRNRYQTATDLIDDLQRYLADQPIQARQLSLWERYTRWRRRNLSLSNFLAMIALLLILTAAVSIGASLREAGLREEAVAARDIAEQARGLADQRREDLQRTLYFAEMNLAGQAASASRGSELIRQKTSHWMGNPEKQKLRGWEWFYLRSMQDQTEAKSELKLPGAISWSPDDTLLAVTCEAGNVAIVEAATGEVIQSIPLRVEPTEAFVAWHPTLPLVAVAQTAGRIRVWDIEEEQVAFSHDDRYGLADSISWTPDGEQLVWGSVRSVKIWDYRGDTRPVRILGAPGIPNVLQWSPDGNRLFAGNWWENKGVLMDMQEQTALQQIPARNVRWDPATGEISHYITTDPKGEITIWDAEQEVIIHRLTGHRSLVRCLQWNRAGTLLMSGGLDNAVRLWDFAAGELARGFPGHQGDIGGLAWSHDEQKFASTGTYSLRIWNVESTVESARREGMELTRSLRWHPRGEVFATAHVNRIVRIWRASDFTQIATLTGHTQEVHSLAWNREGDRLVTCGRDSRVQVFDTSCFLSGPHVTDVPATADPAADPAAAAAADTASDNAEPAESDGLPSLPLLYSWRPGGQLLDVVWSPDGNRVAASGVDKRVTVWDLQQLDAPVFELKNKSDTHCVKWTPDGSRLLLGWGRMITILDGESYAELNRIPLTTRVISLDLNPDTNLVVASGRDPGIEIWNLDTLSLVSRLTGHQGSVWCVDWSPDGRRIASCSEDGTVKIWDPVTGYEALTLADVRPSGEIWNVQFGPNNKRLAASCAGSAVLLWDASTAIEAEQRAGQQPLSSDPPPKPQSGASEPSPRSSTN